MTPAVVVVLCALSALVGYWVGYRRAQQLEDGAIDSIDELRARLEKLADDAEQRNRVDP